ncbi:hypothetical protein BPT24_081 [Tenacibaculum phage pT24]|uniref:Uncharacterized protein n=1 Tax=Tenacibaculum phage pT24 TaxID=1880590 RepID=A0A1B4XWL8_9CAUD|nr:hypothetical protein HYP10_gp081 [Tenacibaculum phage pT24]BAV39206.1 hypothetical protein BPT24_081 [Tenacibaculum phage pT24]
MKRLDITNENNVESVIVKGDRLQQLLNCETVLKNNLCENYSQPIINSMAYSHEIQCEITALEHDKIVAEEELEQVKNLTKEHFDFLKKEIQKGNVLSVNLYKTFNGYFENMPDESEFNIKGLTKFLSMFLGDNVKIYDMGVKNKNNPYFGNSIEDETSYVCDAFKSLMKSFDLSGLTKSDRIDLESAIYTIIYNSVDTKNTNKTLEDSIKGITSNYEDSQKELQKYYGKYYANRWMFYLGLGITIGSIALNIFM